MQTQKLFQEDTDFPQTGISRCVLREQFAALDSQVGPRSHRWRPVGVFRRVKSSKAVLVSEGAGEASQDAQAKVQAERIHLHHTGRLEG